MGLMGCILLMCGAGALAQRPPMDNPEKAPQPAAIARHCTLFVQGMAHRTSDLIVRRDRRVVHAIMEFLADGNKISAMNIGRLGQDSINRIADQAIEQITRGVNHCVATLTRLEAPAELISHVEQAGDRAKMLVEEHRAQAIQHILNALMV